MHQVLQHTFYSLCCTAIAQHTGFITIVCSAPALSLTFQTINIGIVALIPEVVAFSPTSQKCCHYRSSARSGCNLQRPAPRASASTPIQVFQDLYFCVGTVKRLVLTGRDNPPELCSHEKSSSGKDG